MKKLIIIAAIIFPNLIFAQLQMELGLGATQSKYPLKTYEGKRYEVSEILPVVKFSFGYQFNRVLIEVSENPTISRHRNAPKLIGGKVGYEIVDGLMPTVGYYFNYCNSDDRSFNTWNLGVGLKYLKIVNDNAGLFVEGLVSGNNYQLVGGIHYGF